jgi:hypothetical protein
MRDLGKKNFHREAVEEEKKKKIQCVVSGLFWRLGCFDCVFLFVHVSAFVFCGF